MKPSIQSLELLAPNSCRTVAIQNLLHQPCTITPPPPLSEQHHCTPTYINHQLSNPTQPISYQPTPPPLKPLCTHTYISTSSYCTNPHNQEIAPFFLNQFQLLYVEEKQQSPAPVELVFVSYSRLASSAAYIQYISLQGWFYICKCFLRIA